MRVVQHYCHNDWWLRHRIRVVSHFHNDWWQCWGVDKGWWGYHWREFVMIYGMRFYKPFHGLDVFLFRHILQYVPMHEILNISAEEKRLKDEKKMPKEP